MNLRAAQEAARQGRLYPSVILHGGTAGERQTAVVDLARMLLCEAEPAARPCGRCRHCRRIVWPGSERPERPERPEDREQADAAGQAGPSEGSGQAERSAGSRGAARAGRAAAGGRAGRAGAGQDEAPFHPDFQVLERDLKASTSVEATRQLIRAAQVSPFEARGQVFVVASAESLTGEAANALLKGLEEPHVSAPRHYLLLAPARLDLLPTLRSRSLAVFLGPAAALDDERIDAASRAFAGAAASYAETDSALYLLRAAEALGEAGGGWDDPRAGRPWAAAAAAVLRSLAPPVAGDPGGSGVPASPGAPSSPRVGRRAGSRAARLALAEALLTGPAMRLRGIGAERILEGLVARHLATRAGAAPGAGKAPPGGR